MGRLGVGGERPDTLWKQELPSVQSYFENVARWKGLLNSSEPTATLLHSVAFCSFQSSEILSILYPLDVVLRNPVVCLARCMLKVEGHFTLAYIHSSSVTRVL